MRHQASALRRAVLVTVKSREYWRGVQQASTLNDPPTTGRHTRRRYTASTAGHGEVLMFNYPRELADPGRTGMLPPHVYLGSAVRGEEHDPVT